MVNYEPGKLEAIAYKRGRKLIAAVETTGEPYSIVIQPSGQKLEGNGKDAMVFNISVTDRQGREVPDAQNLLHFTVRGAAKIIGAGNGNPSSHEPDKYAEDNWQRHLFNGKCQVTVQSDRNADRWIYPPLSALGDRQEKDFVFSVTGDGLQTAQVRTPLNPSKNQ
jgi:beta-galactosidase